jgi:hypothetical protein
MLWYKKKKNKIYARCRHKWQDNTEMDFKYLSSEDVD